MQVKNLFYPLVFFSLLLMQSCQTDDLPDIQINELDDLFVAGYLPHYGFQRFDFDAIQHIDRLYYFSVAPDSLGNFKTENFHLQNIAQLNKKLTGLQTELFLVVGGWYESETIFPMAEDPERRTVYINKLIGFCLENNIDGIDLDWEAYPKKVPENDYIDLVAELSAETKKNNLRFTVAVAASHHNISAIFVDKVDQLNIMSYGVLDENGNQVTMIQLENWLQNFDTAGIPRRKIIVGVPFYGKRPYHSDDNSPRSIIYSVIVDNASPAYDENQYGKYGFNGRALMQTKTEYLKHNGYFGIMAWELSQDVPYCSDFSLLKTIVKTAK